MEASPTARPRARRPSRRRARPPAPMPPGSPQVGASSRSRALRARSSRRSTTPARPHLMCGGRGQQAGLRVELGDVQDERGGLEHWAFLVLEDRHPAERMARTMLGAAGPLSGHGHELVVGADLLEGPHDADRPAPPRLGCIRAACSQSSNSPYPQRCRRHRPGQRQSSTPNHSSEQPGAFVRGGRSLLPSESVERQVPRCTRSGSRAVFTHSGSPRAGSPRFRQGEPARLHARRRSSHVIPTARAAWHADRCFWADPIARYAGRVARRYSLRASDRDREDVAERLRAATAEGRLLAGELEERLEVALQARTYGELDALVVDLPAPPATVPAIRRRPGLPVVAGATLALGILLSVLAASATAGFARAHSAVAGGPPWMHGRPDGFYHAGPAGLVGALAPLVMIVFLVVVCAALGWLFAQSSVGADPASNA